MVGAAMDTELVSCRLCNNNDKTALLDVSSEKLKYAAEYRQIVDVMTGIKIDPDDKLSLICRPCLTRAIDNYEYRRIARRRNDALLQRRNAIADTIKTEIVDDDDDVEFVSISIDITAKDSALAPSGSKLMEHNNSITPSKMDEHNYSTTTSAQMQQSLKQSEGEIAQVNSADDNITVNKSDSNVLTISKDEFESFMINNNTRDGDIVKRCKPGPKSRTRKRKCVTLSVDSDDSGPSTIKSKPPLDSPPSTRSLKIFSHPSIKSLQKVYPKLKFPLEDLYDCHVNPSVELTHCAVRSHIAKISRQTRRRKPKASINETEDDQRRMDVPEVMPGSDRELKELITSSLGLKRVGPPSQATSPVKSTTQTHSELSLTHLNQVQLPIIVAVHSNSEQNDETRQYEQRPTTPTYSTPIDVEFNQTDFHTEEDNQNPTSPTPTMLASTSQNCSLVEIMEEHDVYVCDQCDVICKSLKSLRWHTAIHKNCVFCGLKFDTIPELKVHLRSCSKITKRVNVKILKMESDKKIAHLLPEGFLKLIRDINAKSADVVSTSVRDLQIPAAVSDQVIPVPLSDQVIPELVSDQVIPELVSDQVIPELVSDQVIPVPVSDQVIPVSVSDNVIPITGTNHYIDQEIPISVNQQDIPTSECNQEIPSLAIDHQFSIEREDTNINIEIDVMHSPRSIQFSDLETNSTGEPVVLQQTCKIQNCLEVSTGDVQKQLMDEAVFIQSLLEKPGCIDESAPKKETRDQYTHLKGKDLLSVIIGPKGCIKIHNLTFLMELYHKIPIVLGQQPKRLRFSIRKYVPPETVHTIESFEHLLPTSISLICSVPNSPKQSGTKGKDIPNILDTFSGTESSSTEPKKSADPVFLAKFAVPKPLKKGKPQGSTKQPIKENVLENKFYMHDSTPERLMEMLHNGEEIPSDIGSIRMTQMIDTINDRFANVINSVASGLNIANNILDTAEIDLTADSAKETASAQLVKTTKSPLPKFKASSNPSSKSVPAVVSNGPWKLPSNKLVILTPKQAAAALKMVKNPSTAFNGKQAPVTIQQISFNKMRTLSGSIIRRSLFPDKIQPQPNVQLVDPLKPKPVDNSSQFEPSSDPKGNPISAINPPSPSKTVHVQQNIIIPTAVHTPNSKSPLLTEQVKPVDDIVGTSSSNTVNPTVYPESSAASLKVVNSLRIKSPLEINMI